MTQPPLADIILDVALRLYSARLQAQPKSLAQDRDQDLELLNLCVSDAQDLTHALIEQAPGDTH